MMPSNSPATTLSAPDQRIINPKALEKLRLTVIDLFAQGLFQDVGMREIATRAKVGLATIYKYFGNKDELVFACIHQDLAYLGELLNSSYQTHKTQDSRQQLKACLTCMVEFYLNHRQIAEIVYLNVPTRLWVSETQPMQIQQVKLMREIIVKGQKKGEIRGDQPIEVMVQLLLGGIFRYLVAYLLNQLPQKKPTEVSQEIFECLWPMLQKIE
jgi:AcrR family transcriptional regulator